MKEVADHFNERKNLYEAEIKQLKSKIADLEDKNLDFRAKLEKFHLATPELVKENELWRRKHADIEKDYKEKSQELNDLKNLDHENLDLLKSNLDQTRKKENGLLNELLILQQALQEKDREINVLKAKNQNQGNQIEQILNENNKKTQDAINLDKKCKELLNELNALKSSHPLINEERKKEFNDRIKDLEGKITLMINENQRLTDLIKEKATENEYIAKILRDKLDENDHLKTLLAQNQNKNMNYEAMKNDLENKKNREIVFFYN